MSDIVVIGGRDAVLDFGPVTRRSLSTGLPVAIDLSLAGTKLWFTVKVNPSDAQADAVIEKTYVQGGSSDGILVVTPSSAEVPNGTISIPRDVLVAGTYLYWDLLLEEPGSPTRRSTVDSGAFKVLRGVSSPA